MGDGDVKIYGPARPDQIGALVTAGNNVIADDYTMCNVAGGLVLVMVIKAA